jgi:hypothetical protein
MLVVLMSLCAVTCRCDFLSLSLSLHPPPSPLFSRLSFSPPAFLSSVFSPSLLSLLSLSLPLSHCLISLSLSRSRALSACVRSRVRSRTRIRRGSKRWRFLKKSQVARGEAKEGQVAALNLPKSYHLRKCLASLKKTPDPKFMLRRVLSRASRSYEYP